MNTKEGVLLPLRATTEELARFAIRHLQEQKDEGWSDDDWMDDFHFIAQDDHFATTCHRAREWGLLDWDGKFGDLVAAMREMHSEAMKTRKGAK